MYILAAHLVVGNSMKDAVSLSSLWYWPHTLPLGTQARCSIYSAVCCSNSHEHCGDVYSLNFEFMFALSVLCPVRSLTIVTSSWLSMSYYSSLTCLRLAHRDLLLIAGVVVRLFIFNSKFYKPIWLLVSLGPTVSTIIHLRNMCIVWLSSHRVLKKWCQFAVGCTGLLGRNT